MGFEVLGDNDSPVMPIMLYNPAKIPAFSRECLKQKVSGVPVKCYFCSECFFNS
jgi:serine palmitoyltransferase